jgi:hypothetical protein
MGSCASSDVKNAVAPNGVAVPMAHVDPLRRSEAGTMEPSAAAGLRNAMANPLGRLPLTHQEHGTPTSSVRSPRSSSASQLSSSGLLVEVDRSSSSRGDGEQQCASRSSSSSA